MLLRRSYYFVRRACYMKIDRLYQVVMCLSISYLYVAEFKQFQSLSLSEQRSCFELERFKEKSRCVVPITDNKGIFTKIPIQLDVSTVNEGYVIIVGKPFRRDDSSDAQSL